jgi:uncharacterized protein YecE (DUF72 family)
VIWVGTCGFGRRPANAFRDLHAVEIQETFSRPVTVERATSWHAAAPADFVFAVKASQFITHEATSPTYRRAGRRIPETDRSRYGGFQDTSPVWAGWAWTKAVAETLRARVIVFQCPSSFGPSPEHVSALYRFFESTRTEAIRAWEPRGPWAPHILEKVCEDLGLVHVVDPFAAEPATAGLAYFRLHGSPPGPRPYRCAYTSEDLVRLKAMANEYDDAYVMFNNLSMASDAVRFRALVEGAKDA